MPTPFDLTAAKTVHVYTESGVFFGSLLAVEEGDHPDTARALEVGAQIDRRYAEFKKARKRVYSTVTEGMTTFKAALPAFAELAQDFTDWLLGKAPGSPSLFLSTAKVHAGEAEYAILRRVAPGANDVVAAMQKQEWLSRLDRLERIKQLEVLKEAVDLAATGSARHLQFLQAVTDDPIMSTVTEPLRTRLAQVVLELSDPAAYRAWRRLTVQLEALESFIEAAANAVRSDKSLQVQWTPAQLAQREKDEGVRRLAAAQRG